MEAHLAQLYRTRWLIFVSALMYMLLVFSLLGKLIRVFLLLVF